MPIGSASVDGISPIETRRRFDTMTAAAMIAKAATAMPMRPNVEAFDPTVSFTTAGAISTATRFMTLINGLIDGAGSVLERVADGVADDRGRVGVGALAAVDAVLDHLLRVVPGATGVGQEDRHQHAGADRTSEVAGQRSDAE